MRKSKKKSSKGPRKSNLETALELPPERVEESDYAEPGRSDAIPGHTMKLHRYEAYVHEQHPKTGLKAYEVREGIFEYLRHDFKKKNLEMTITNIKRHIKKVGVSEEYAKVILEWKKLGEERKLKGEKKPFPELHRLREEFPPGIYDALATKYDLPRF